MPSIKDEIQSFRAIIDGDDVSSSNGTKIITESTQPAAINRFKLTAYAMKAVPRYFNLTAFCADHSGLVRESRDYRTTATRLIARRIAEGFDMSDYVKTDARDYYSILARNLRHSLLKENTHVRGSILTEGLPNHDTSWLVSATETMRRSCEEGNDCNEVINSLAREYARTEGGHHEAFEMARDALSKRAWELDLMPGPTEYDGSDEEETYSDYDDEEEKFAFGDVEDIASSSIPLQSYR